MEDLALHGTGCLVHLEGVGYPAQREGLEHEPLVPELASRKKVRDGLPLLPGKRRRVAHPRTGERKLPTVYLLPLIDREADLARGGADVAYISLVCHKIEGHLDRGHRSCRAIDVVEATPTSEFEGTL